MKAEESKPTATIKDLQYNGTFDIAIGDSRKEVHWKNKEMLWSDFLKRISEPRIGNETAAEYAIKSKTHQDNLKDVGGFVGGYINGGQRKKENILHRQLITLDLDYADASFWGVMLLICDNAAAIYSTRKHSPEKPRLRLIMPLDRPVTTEEYEAIARRVAGWIDINYFDDTTYEPARLMYWPSKSKDAQFIFEYQDGPWLSADTLLASYKDWKDSSEWPVSERAGEIMRRQINKQQNPTEKTGIIGAFCRTYNIHDVIDTYLPDIYEATADDDRYTYKGGSTAGGLVVYDGLYAYSHHGTDPATGKLCNAFDLVRIHKYGTLDENAKPGTPSNVLPSQAAMEELASKDPAVRKLIGSERLESCSSDFAEVLPIDTDWMAEMDADKKGNYNNTIDNIMIVLNNDPNLKGLFALDELEQREVATRNMPWRKITHQTRWLNDRDDSGLRHYLEKIYNLTSEKRIKDAMNMVVIANKFHPIRDYLNSLKWDGTHRVEALFIDYLGAQDSAYIRAVTRKALVAAVARVFQPGCKFDYTLVIIGDQGIGKSTLVRLLGRDWFSDTFYGVEGKEAFEQIQGVWIMEIAELAGIKKAEAEKIKHFLSKLEDRYRVAYGKRIEDFPRQCIFIGTTNTKEFLSDTTGNRRFWPVTTRVVKPTKNVFSLTSDDINQIWAEAVQLYKAGEDLFLSKDLELEAMEHQKEHRIEDERKGLIEMFLDKPLPEDWDYMDSQQRRSFYSNDELSPRKGTKARDMVTVAEIWVEMLNKPQTEMNNFATKPLHAILRTFDGWEQLPKKRKHPLYGLQITYKRTIPASINADIDRAFNHSKDEDPF